MTVFEPRLAVQLPRPTIAPERDAVRGKDRRSVKSLTRRPMPSITEAVFAALFSRMLLLTGGIVSSLLLPLVIEQGEVGTYFVAQVFVAGTSIAALFGFTHTAPATVTARLAAGDLGAARQLCLQAISTSLSVSLLLAVLTWHLAPIGLSSLGYLDLGEFPTELWIVVWSVPFTTLAALCAELLRAVHAFRWASSLNALTGITPALYVVGCLGLGVPATLSGALVAALLGAAMSASLGSLILALQIGKWGNAQAPMGYLSLVWATLPNLMTTMVLFALSQFDLILLSLWMGPHPVAHYGLALRIAGLLVLPLALATSVLSPIAVELRTTNQIARLQRMLVHVSIATSGLAMVGYLVFVAFGGGLIGYWMPGYEQIYALVLALGAGQVAHAMLGSGGTLLMIFGHQRYALGVTLSTGALTVVLCVVGLRTAGPLGLAIGAGVGIAAQSAAFAVSARRLLGLRSSFLLPQKAH